MSIREVSESLERDTVTWLKVISHCAGCQCRALCTFISARPETPYATPKPTAPKMRPKTVSRTIPQPLPNELELRFESDRVVTIRTWRPTSTSSSSGGTPNEGRICRICHGCCAVELAAYHITPCDIAPRVAARVGVLVLWFPS